MNENNFTDEDKKDVISFLNMIAKHAEFKMSTNEIIEYFQLLSKMQKTILPKIDANVMEVIRVVESEEPKEE